MDKKIPKLFIIIMILEALVIFFHVKEIISGTAALFLSIELDMTASLVFRLVFIILAICTILFIILRNKIGLFLIYITNIFNIITALVTTIRTLFFSSYIDYSQLSLADGMSNPELKSLIYRIIFMILGIGLSSLILFLTFKNRTYFYK